MYAPTLVVVCMDGSEAVFNNCQFTTNVEVLKDVQGQWVRSGLGDLRIEQTLADKDGAPLPVTTVFLQSSYTGYEVSVL